MVTEIAFLVLVALVAIQRLWELRKSARNEARLRAAGAVEHAPHQMFWMRATHALWLCAMPVEVFALHRPAIPALGIAALTVFAIGQALRLSAMRALGWRWNVRILTLPGRAPVVSGVFRHLRHPNYLGVVLEIAALPLVHSAWITAIVFSTLNALVLWRRIRAEEAALEEAGGYVRDRPAFFPHWRTP